MIYDKNKNTFVYRNVKPTESFSQTQTNKTSQPLIKNRFLFNLASQNNEIGRY